MGRLLSMQEQLEIAIEVALEAHRGQVGKGGHPYIVHPLKVMSAMSTDFERICAVLHDVCEDSVFTLKDLRERGFEDSVLEVLDLLTHEKGIPYMRYITRLKNSQNQVAINVKVEDLRENMNKYRIASPTSADISRIDRVYRVAYEELTSDDHRIIIREPYDKSTFMATHEESDMMVMVVDAQDVGYLRPGDVIDGRFVESRGDMYEFAPDVYRPIRKITYKYI